MPCDPLSRRPAARRVLAVPARMEQDDVSPKFEQLRQEIVNCISSGQLKPGDALPAERQLAEMHQVARSTVRLAMNALQRAGIVRRIQGRGTFIEEEAPDLCRGAFDAFALLLPEAHSGFFPALQHSFDNATAESHHQLLVCNTGGNIDRQGRIILQLLDKQVDGVALIPVTTSETPAYQIRQLQRAGIPVVICLHRVEEVHTPFLGIPFRETGRIVAQELVDRGHRRIGFLAPDRSPSVVSIEAALRSELAERGAHIAPGCALFGTESPVVSSQNESEIIAALAAMLERPDRPTALFVASDLLAESVFLAAQRLGWRVPQEISIVGFGGMVRSTPVLRLLTSVTIDERQLGERAARLLWQMRVGNLPLTSRQTWMASVATSAGQTLADAPGDLAMGSDSARRV